MAKSLVAYFSATGTTKRLAERLAKVAGADLFQIEPQQPYTSADLNWSDGSSRTTQEKNDPSTRPAITGSPDTAPYDVVYIGFPIWWYTAPNVVHTFLEACNLAGKTVVPFATSDGSSMGRTAQSLAASAQGAKVEQGAVLNGASDARLARFVGRFQ
ncbi:MAG: flavodoxin [Coriobacteriaceae bacterium]|jgi:FMN-dependent NADH-azoreductase|nr:NAD(P)H-dependent oxidoreductase [Olsenella sp.]RRF89515.1 MAG: flavodoxin [Coriobacteriaceae bacterium]